MEKQNNKVKIELDWRELSYFLGMMELDLRYGKDKEDLARTKKLFSYFKTELDKLYFKDKTKEGINGKN